MMQELVKSGTPVSEQAAAWFFVLADRPIEQSTRRDFVAWLKRSPQHIDSFLAISTLEQELAGRSSDLDEILKTVKSGSGQNTIYIDRGVDVADESIRSRDSRIASRRYALVAAAAIAITSATALLLSSLPSPDSTPPAAVVHKTDFGEQRSIALRDGSIVTLNTRSELGVRFDEAVRRVELVSGEAMFDVASNGKPFVVDTGAVELEVLGTRFTVYRQPESVRVAVVEGVVRAVSGKAPGEHILVSAGQGAVASIDGSLRRDEHIDLDKATAWTERRLVFDEAPLADVVQEFNRYNRVPLVVDDSRLAKRTITSVFNANDVSALIAFLELEPDVQVVYGADAIRISVRH